MASETIKRELPANEDFYVNTALYTEFDIFPIDKERVFQIVFQDVPLDCYCIDCSANSVFIPVENKPQLQSTHNVYFPISNGIQWGIDLLATNSIFQKEFTCSRNTNHKLNFFVQIKNGKLTKIGQSPAIADIAEQEIRKYKKILGNIHYNEFSKAIGLYAHGIGVGSFVYLRRIIENYIIKPAYESAKIKPEWNEATYQKLRVKDKIDLLKNDLPDFLVKNTEIYSIISKGIHELTENECKKYFPVLKTCLEFILTDLEAKRETEQKRKDMQTTLSKIKGELI